MEWSEWLAGEECGQAGNAGFVVRRHLLGVLGCALGCQQLAAGFLKFSPGQDFRAGALKWFKKFHGVW